MELQVFPLVERYHQQFIVSQNQPVFTSAQVINHGSFKFIIKAPIDQSWTIIDIVQKCTPNGWRDIFVKAWSELQVISQQLLHCEQTEGPFFPLKKDIFKVFELCPPTTVKIVIFGQDPYHSVDGDGLPTAQGISFSVRKTARIPPSLINVYKVLAKTIPEFTMPIHGDLTEWIKQGVFMLNASLTVLPGKAGSHKGQWLGFIKKVIDGILDLNPNIIFLLWGRDAQGMKKIINNRGHILETSHPSPLGARYGFLNCDHFNQANQKLIELGQRPIDWRITN